MSDEPTIHLEPVTQIVEGNEFFVGIPVTEQRVPTSTDLFGMHTHCARSVFLAPVVDLRTNTPGVGVYVHDHHGRRQSGLRPSLCPERHAP